MSVHSLKPEDLEKIASQVKADYQAAVERTRQVAARLDELNRLQAKAKASPRAIAARRAAKKPVSIF